MRNYRNYKFEEKELTQDSLVLFNDKLDEPTSLIFGVKAGPHYESTGLVVGPEQFSPGTNRPKDFRKFWKREKKALRALSMEIQSVEVYDIDEGYICADVEINCNGPKPARGYYAKPAYAKPKSLPIVLLVHAAGVKGSWCLSKPENAMQYAKKGALCFDLNAHGMLNGQPQEYYDNLEEGELKEYASRGKEHRDSFYFKGMYLRLVRTLDFLCKQPEWDGKRIIVIGESQGGGQALAAAGLDKRVSVAVATVPAMCDWGGTLAGNKGGWPNPFASVKVPDQLLNSVPYFDTAHLLKGSKTTIVAEIGFIDYACSSNSIYAAINQSKGEKIVFGVPYRGHHLDQKSFQKHWEETVYKPKMKFIDDFLK